MKVVVAPDSFGGTLTAAEAAAAIADGWRRVRPQDRVVTVPMSDGGEGLLDTIATPDDTWFTAEVAGPLGHPVEAAVLLRADGSAVIESARVCGLGLVPESRRSPMLTTTYGVGELLDAVLALGVRRILLGLGGSATVDGGAGALAGLGYRLRVEDGSGLKVGGDDLHRIDRIEPGWARAVTDVEVALLADVTTVLLDAARDFGPQKGATPPEVASLTRALGRWADVVERDLTGGRVLREHPGTGAAGGLGFGLAAALHADLVPGVEVVADLVGLGTVLVDADVVVSGEGRLDAMSRRGKVVGHVVDRATRAGVPSVAVVGQHAPDADRTGVTDLVDVEAAAPNGPGDDPAREVEDAAARLARRTVHPHGAVRSSNGRASDAPRT